jgi:hypothetical protein
VQQRHLRLKVINPQNPASPSTTTVSDGVESGRYNTGTLDNGPLMSLAFRDGKLCAAWEDRRDTFAIYGACSTDNGATWSQPVALTAPDTPYKVGSWDVSIDATGQLLVSWVRVDLNSNDLFLSTSVDRGANFSFNVLEDGQGQYGSSLRATRTPGTLRHLCCTSCAPTASGCAR